MTLAFSPDSLHRSGVDRYGCWRLAPRHGQAVGVTQIDPRDIVFLILQCLAVDGTETTYFFHQMVAPQ